MPEFRNPNQGGGGGSQDNRSFLLMMIVALGVIFGLQYWRSQKNPALESPEHPAAVTASATAGTSSTSPSPSVATSSTASATPAVVATAQSSTTVGEHAVQDHLLQPGRTGHLLDPEKVQGQRRPSPGHGA